MFPVTYSVRDASSTVAIRRCPQMAWLRSDGTRGYWYLARPLYREDAPLIFDSGLKTWYWNGETWDWQKPKQFRSAQAALKEYLKKRVEIEKYPPIRDAAREERG